MKKSVLFLSLLLACHAQFAQTFEEKEAAMEKEILQAKEKYGESSGQYESGLVQMALLQMQNGKFRESLEWLSRLQAMLTNMNLGKSADAVWAHYYQGSVHYSLSEPENAISHFEKVISISTDTKQEDSAFAETSLGYIANCYIMKGDFENAEKYIECEIEKAETLHGKESEQYIMARSRKGALFQEAGNLEDAKKEYLAVIETAKTTEGADAYIHGTYNSLAAVLLFQGKPYDAIQYFKSALSLIEKGVTQRGENEKKTESLILEGMALAYANTGDYEKSKELLQKAIAEAEGIDTFRSNLAVFYNDISSTYDMLGEREKSSEALERAYEIYERLEKETGFPELNFASVCANMAYKSCLKKNNVRAEAFIAQALGILEKAKVKSEFHAAKTYLTISRIFFIEGKLSEAYDFQKRAIDIQERTFGKESDTAAATYLNFANTCAALSKNEEALLNYEKAINIIRKIHGEKSSFEGQFLTQRAMLQKKIGDTTEAEESLRTALEIFEKESDGLAWHKALILWELAQFAFKRGSEEDVFEGFSLLDKAILHFENSEEHKYVADRMTETVVFMKKGLGELNFEFKNEENKEYVMSIMKRACDLGIRQAEKARLASYPDDRTEMTAQVYPLFYSAIDLALKNGDEESALFYSESFRNRGFLEQLGARTALSLPEITNEERSEYERLTKSISDLESQISTHEKSEQERKQKNLLEAERALKRLQDELVKKNPKCAQLLFPKPIDAKNIMKECPDDTVVLEYVIWNSEYAKLNTELSRKLESSAVSMQNGSWCIIVSKDKIKTVGITDTEKIMSETRRFRRLIEEKRGISDTEIKECAQKLYEALLSDAEKHFSDKIKNVVIVPDGGLHTIPFDMLENENGEFGSRYTVTFSPSISVSRLASLSNTYGTERLMAIGNPLYENGEEAGSRGLQKKKLLIPGKGGEKKEHKEEICWQNIPGTGAEIEGIKNAVFGERMDTLMGSDAQESELKKLSRTGELSSFKILHFACHGYFNENTPSLSGLVFSEAGTATEGSAEDGYLRISEAAVLGINADFVNLSACQTGLSGARAGEGFEGLSRAFLQAGAKQVGVTLWSVDDEATSHFMISLYKKIDSGKAYKEAYKETKEEFKRSGVWSSPYYWAAFALYE